jgi:hypothetical protein
MHVYPNTIEGLGTAGKSRSRNVYYSVELLPTKDTHAFRKATLKPLQHRRDKVGLTVECSMDKFWKALGIDPNA